MVLARQLEEAEGTTQNGAEEQLGLGENVPQTAVLTRRRFTEAEAGFSDLCGCRAWLLDLGFLSS